MQESLALSLGEFFARAKSSSHEAELKTKEQQALSEELALVKEQMAKQAQSFFIRETALTQELGVLRKVELEANKRLHDEGQKYTTLLSKGVPLRVEVVELKEEAASNKDKMTNLEERSVEREVHLGKVEAELTRKLKTLKRPRQNSLMMFLMPMLLGLKMPLLRLFANMLRWTLRPFPRRTTLSTDRLCQGVLRRIPISL